MEFNNLEKKLSIIIKLFKDIDKEEKLYSIPYDKISIKNDNEINLKTITFYNNIENKLFHIIYFLTNGDKINMGIGDADILNLKLLLERYKNDGKKIPEERGLLRGVWGDIKANINIGKNIPAGNYEICVFAKELNNNINTLEEFKKKTSELRTLFIEKNKLDIIEQENYLKDNKYYLASSAPILLERVEE